MVLRWPLRKAHPERYGTPDQLRALLRAARQAHDDVTAAAVWRELERRCLVGGQRPRGLAGR